MPDDPTAGNDLAEYKDPVRTKCDIAVDELVGLCRGLIADGAICENEARYLKAWILHNDRDLAIWPANQIYPRVTAMLRDGVLDEQEKRELLELLECLVGEKGGALYHPKTTSLPIDTDMVSIVFTGKVFCFSGRFACGQQKRCRELTRKSGGKTVKEVYRSVDYLVLGESVNPQWKHSPFGRKIEKALAMKDNGEPIHLISERRWHENLPALVRPSVQMDLHELV